MPRNGIAERRQERDITANDLAEHLFLVSSGITETHPDPGQERQQLLTAARIVVQARPGTVGA